MADLAGTSRRLARRLALDGLSTGWRLTGRERAGLGRPRVHFVYLHALPPTHEARFDAWIGRLLQTHRPLSHSAAVDTVLHGPIDRPAVSISVDDAFGSCTRIGQLLARRGVSACFFVPTGFVGTPTVQAARAFFGTARGVDEPALTWGDVEALRAAGHEIGSHTETHPDLGSATPTRVQHEIEVSVAELRSRLGACAHFAWPLGTFAHFSAAAARAVEAAGLRSCASAVRGAHTVPAADPARLCLRRDHVPPEWPHRHGRYFLARAAARSSAGDNEWPAGWGAGS